MTSAKSIMEISAGEWLAALGMSPEDVPLAVIVEGSWWRQQRTDWRLSYLSDAEELRFPDIFVGNWRGRRIVYCCAYGAPRTVEIAHIFALLGSKLVIQIGTCGGLQPQLQPGDIILPKVAIARDGVAQLYGAVDGARCDATWTGKAHMILNGRGHSVHHGTHLTWSSIFAQDRQLIETWHHAGYLSVDMETATTFAAASYFGASAVAMLVVWDDLMRGKSFLDPLEPDRQKALDRGNRDAYEVALQLVEKIETAG